MLNLIFLIFLGSSRILGADLDVWHYRKLWSAEIQTKDCWARSINVTSVLCFHKSWPLLAITNPSSFLGSHKFNIMNPALAACHQSWVQKAKDNSPEQEPKLIGLSKLCCFTALAATITYPQVQQLLVPSTTLTKHWRAVERTARNQITLPGLQKPIPSRVEEDED